MQAIRVVFTAILLGPFCLARPFVNCSAPLGASVAGTDFIIARDGRIAAIYLFFDKLP